MLYVCFVSELEKWIGSQLETKTQKNNHGDNRVAHTSNSMTF